MPSSIYNLPHPGPSPACPLPSLPSYEDDISIYSQESFREEEYDDDVSIYSQDSDDCEWVLEMDPLDSFSEVAPPAADMRDGSFESSDDDDSAPATPTSAQQQESESESEGNKPVTGVVVEKRPTSLKTLKAKLLRRMRSTLECSCSTLSMKLNACMWMGADLGLAAQGGFGVVQPFPFERSSQVGCSGLSLRFEYIVPADIRDLNYLFCFFIAFYYDCWKAREHSHNERNDVAPRRVIHDLAVMLCSIEDLDVFASARMRVLLLKPP
ncbi:uncharacterized protein BT62DRAFT_1005153 [Guyanagaster necrorhizus]|uniref:Uncharacterized protein n=1 Tax=Guyanagaster necrorhizus TaxID=856835 RepID=A0A9P7VUE7_9AGAR|nr:uncharacterized protein BT62DRAFT_1005153 [Guyanagaster necrorhizus MCA 3950]KAG7446772.1 hypothetical protein BT62DRAFT_1005153 [Guyanagaster necrorhizus MCA 3950]